MIKLYPFLIMTVLLALPVTVASQIPRTISYQGLLADSLGNPKSDGTYTFTFRLYDVGSGGTPVWTEIKDLQVRGGLFFTALGDVTSLGAGVLFDRPYWLSIKPGSEPELSPRIPLSSVGYSFNSIKSDTAQFAQTVIGGSFLPLNGGTMTGAISNAGDPPITMGKGNFGSGNINTGTQAFAAGSNNRARGNYSVVGGGGGPTAADSNSAIGLYSTVGGGNANTASSNYSTVGGGSGNVTSGSSAATVGGGVWNIASEIYATIGGGSFNSASGYASTVGGGRYDPASLGYATVAGGYLNKASGFSSFAAGQFAKAIHDGAFVWGDYNSVDFTSTAANQFSVRASGGTRIYSNSALSAGVTLAAGGSAWSSVSDSTLKRNIRLVDGKDILGKLVRLPIKQWSYRSQNPGIEHIGPMAQDFHALFGLGDDDKTISTIDPAGIALAAIQELDSQNKELKERVTELETLVRSLLSEMQNRANGSLGELR